MLRNSLKKSYKDNKLKYQMERKISVAWFSCSVSDIQDYLESFIKKYEELTDNPPIRNMGK